MRHVLALSLALAPLAAQPAAVPATYTSYGAGCQSSGRSYGQDIVVPAAQAASFGNSSNNIPFSWQATRYQQLYLSSETGSGANVIGIGFRQDEAYQNHDSHKVELELWLGGTTFGLATLTNTFATNFNSTTSPKTRVFTKRYFALPKMPALPTDPTVPLFTIPLDAPWQLSLGTDNLLLEIVQTATSNNNVTFTYPLDAHSSTTTTRLYSAGLPAAPTGLLTVGYGMITWFRTSGTTVLPRPTIYNSNRPVVGRDFHFQLQGFSSSVLGVVLAGSTRATLDLGAFGAPGCSLLTNPLLAAVVPLGPGGDLAMTMSVPNDSSLDGQNAFIQAAALDVFHALGFSFSNGGQLTFGLN